MKVLQSTIEGVPLIVVEGDLDHTSKQLFRDTVLETLQGPYPPQNILFDLTECTFLDSGGLSVILSALAQLPAQGWLGLIGANKGTLRVLEYSGVHGSDKVRSFSSTSDAAASLARERRLQ